MITKGERSELRTLIRQRFKVLRADIAQRETELYAELEDRLNERCAAEDKGWADVGFAIAEAAREASRKANDIVRQHVGRDLWPKDYGLVQPAVLSRIRAMITTSTPDRTQLRRTGHAHIAATIKAAQLELDRQEVDLLTKLATTETLKAERDEALAALTREHMFEKRHLARALDAERNVAAAEVRGYKRAIAALRDDAADRDSRALCLRNAANYLESLTTEGTAERVCSTCEGAGTIRCLAHMAADGCEDGAFPCPDCTTEGTKP